MNEEMNDKCVSSGLLSKRKSLPLQHYSRRSAVHPNGAEAKRGLSRANMQLLLLLRKVWGSPSPGQLLGSATLTKGHPTVSPVGWTDHQVNTATPCGPRHLASGSSPVTGGGYVITPVTGDSETEGEQPTRDPLRHSFYKSSVEP